MEQVGGEETPEAAARRALRQAFDSGSSRPLAAAADLLVETVMSHPELMQLFQEMSSDELSAIAEAIPNGFAARLGKLGLVAGPSHDASDQHNVH